MRGNPKQSLDSGLFHAVDSRFQVIDSGFQLLEGYRIPLAHEQAFPGHSGGGAGKPHLFERLFLISWENNRDCHITMPRSLKTMEVQIKRNQ